VTTNYSAQLDALPGDVQAIADLADRSAPPQPVGAGGLYIVPTGEGGRRLVDLTGDEYLDTPRRKTGTVRVRDTNSFGLYWDKHHTSDVSEVYADLDRDQIVAVLDAHAGDTPGWQDHSLVLGVRRTRNWQTWTALDNQLVGQVEFAEHIEANLGDIAEPAGAELLELAQTFQATTAVNFKSANRLTSGERELVYSEQIDASAGRDRKITIPAGLKLALRPYEDNDLTPITARFRYRLKGGSVVLGYVLDQPDDVLRDAFASLVEMVEARIGGPVMFGTPA
jgi:uncharacterized protein YfdQ (DUF2303 family)